MATVNFISSKSQSRGSLGRVMKYVEQDEKTLMKNGLKLVSGQTCFPQLAFREFNATREAHRKNSPVWFYHYTQSFHPKEKVTPELAHRIAKEFAEQAWPENEVLIATHIDAAHIHSHFIVNSVCHESGKMLRQGPNTLQQLRDLSDQLCLKFDLSVLPKSHKRRGREPDRREYRAAVKGQSWKLRLMNTIDECMHYAGNREEFIRLMQSEGYDVRWEGGRKYITYTTPTGKLCRDKNLHEEKYLKGRMEHEFRIRKQILTGTAPADEPEAGDARTDHDPMSDGQRDLGRAARPAGRDHPSAENDQSETGWPGDADGADTDAGDTDGGPEHDDATGWEEEREAYLAMALAPAEHSSGLGLDRAAPVVPRNAVGDLVRLGRDLERSIDNAPVIDSTTLHGHTDSKEHRKIREKKIAMGQKPDDHEEQYTYNMPTM